MILSMPALGLAVLSMPALGLALLALYGLLAVGVRIVVQVRRTGSTGFNGLRGASGFLEWAGGLLFAIAIVLCVTGPALQLVGVLGSVQALDGDVASIVGAALASLGIAITVVAQFAMGDAWRIGVDPVERTELITSGPFSLVRNPIYAAMIPSFTGIALLAPNVVTLSGAVLLIVAVELQTRLIEEPHLAKVHGAQYAAYAARVGRLVPGIGRPRRKRQAAPDAQSLNCRSQPIRSYGAVCGRESANLHKLDRKSDKIALRHEDRRTPASLD
jgi:protein-S-isoprenylcysteine O-methyltransferase Ste14